MRLFHQNCRRAVLFALALAAPLGWLIAGNTGKIAGRVTDAATGDPLVGTNIVIEGTSMGASADPSGEYFVINLPAGRYALRVSLLGYETVRVREVEVNADKTTRVDVQMNSEVIAGREVTIVATKPVVEKDVTSTSTSVSSQELQHMPVNTVDAVLKTVAGVVSDGSSLHFRGGRGNEVSYMVDGVPVVDPLYGRAGQMVGTSAVEEMVVVTGTYNAEYGNAMSGIVNVITKEGGSGHHGRLRYFVGHPGTVDTSAFFYDEDKLEETEEHVAYVVNESFDDADSSASWEEGEAYQDWNGNGRWDSAEDEFQRLKDELQRSLADLQRYELTLNGPMPLLKGFHYSLNIEGQNSAGWMPFAYDRQEGVFAEDLPIGSFFSKLSYTAPFGLKVFGTFHEANRNWRDYLHFFKYLPSRQAENSERSRQMTVGGSFQFSSYTVAEATISTYSNTFFEGAATEWMFDDSLFYFGGESNFVPRYDGPNEFAVGGYHPSWIETISERTMVKGSVTSQVNKYNMLKGGFSLVQNSLQRVSHDSFGDQWYDWIDQDFLYEPTEVSAYIQDKLEFRHLILNAGLRFDQFDPKADFWDDPRDSNLPDEAKAAALKWQISPRLGFSHPITDRSVLHFAYGHFFQVPNYEFLYWNLRNRNLQSGQDAVDLTTVRPTVGDPDLEPQKTVAIEIGWEQQVGGTARLDVTAFYKDIQNMITSRFEHAGAILFTRFTNSDYGNVRGVEVALDNRFSDRLSVSVNYTLSRAEGNSSDLFEAFYDVFANPPRVLPKRTLALDWDQLHTLSFHMEGNTAGLPNLLLRDWTVSMIGNYGSGLPYTPTNPQGIRVGEVNSETMPATFTVDLHVTRALPGPLSGARFFLDVRNLLNRQNVIAVDPTTGLPDRSLWHAATYDGVKNPAMYAPPRTLTMGLDIQW